MKCLGGNNKNVKFRAVKLWVYSLILLDDVEGKERKEE